jgi:predicted DNA-binding transcriptional regulator YafY
VSGTVREVEPWGVVSWRGRWYLVGHDRDRVATRVFRLSRVEGDVVAFGPEGVVSRPDGVDLRAIVESTEPADVPAQTARVRLRPGAGWSLRRQAAAGQHDPDELTLTFHDSDRLAEQLVSLGPDVVVLEPDELRAAVRQRLRGARDAHR